MLLLAGNPCLQRVSCPSLEIYPLDHAFPFQDMPISPGANLTFWLWRKNYFTARRSAVPRQVISAMGGMGKSQLAVELAYRYGRFLDGVHWINAAADISAEFAACGQAMQLEYWPEKLPDQVAATLKAWQEGKGSGELRLLVLDNLEEPDTLGEWLPQLSGLRLLVTSRRTDYRGAGGVQVYPLEELPRAESLTLLRTLAVHLKEVPDYRAGACR